MSFLFRSSQKGVMPSPDQALPGREQSMLVASAHQVLQHSMQPPFPEDCEQLIVGMGCFWGAERCFWQRKGVYTTAVGYSAGYTPNPSYEEVCSGLTGHNEVVLVVYRPAEVSLEALLQVFWESHNPTQGMRQGNDVGTQYRSGIYCSTDTQLAEAEASKVAYANALAAAGVDAEITTEIKLAEAFYYAEDYHQQYLHKNPSGYCGLGGLGVSCPGR